MPRFTKTPQQTIKHLCKIVATNNLTRMVKILMKKNPNSKNIINQMTKHTQSSILVREIIRCKMSFMLMKTKHSSHGTILSSLILRRKTIFSRISIILISIKNFLLSKFKMQTRVLHHLSVRCQRSRNRYHRQRLCQLSPTACFLSEMRNKKFQMTKFCQAINKSEMV